MAEKSRETPALPEFSPDPVLTAAEKQTLEAAKDAYVTALRHYLDVIRQLSPYQVGQVIPQQMSDAPLMLIKAIASDTAGCLFYSGKQVTAKGPGKRSAMRHINLHHLVVAED